jgi:hypothetical protein
MESTTMKRAISATLFGLGILVGIAGCAIYPMAVFTVGANDSSQEVWGISLVFLSLFPTSILALRFRLIAGCIMLFVPCFFIYSSLAQRTFMVNVRHFPQPPIGSKQIIGSFALTWPYVVLGAFAILTSMLSWPPVVRWPRLVSLPSQSEYKDRSASSSSTLVLGGSPPTRQ